jgi:hypothetical protein
LLCGQISPLKRAYGAKGVVLMIFFHYKRERERERESEFTPKSGVPPVKAFFTLMCIIVQEFGEKSQYGKNGGYHSVLPN